MKPKFIQVNKFYTVRVGRKLVEVQVLSVGERNGKPAWRVLELESKRQLVVFNHTKFRSELKRPRFDFDEGRLVFGEEKPKKHIQTGCSSSSISSSSSKAIR